MIKIIKRTFTILIIVIILFVVFMVNGFIENASITKQINDFKSRGVYIDTENNIKYFEVKAIDGEDGSNIKSSIRDRFVGRKGDIYVTSRNPLNGNALTSWISSKTWVGHSGIVYDNEGLQTIEIAGTLSKSQNKVKIFQNTWIGFSDDTPQIALLRVKDITDEELDNVIEYAESKIGYPYNYTFLFNKSNSFYCSDFVSRAYKYAGRNINYDYLATTGSDMIASGETYFAYYQERIVTNGEVTYEVYYLVE